MNLEVNIFQALNGLVNQSGILDWFIVFLGNYSAYLIVALAVWWIWREKNWRLQLYHSSFIALAIIISRGILTPIIRFLHSRPRPFELMDFNQLINHDAGASLPSGHAAFFFALAFAIYFSGYRKRGVFLLVATLLMGASRVAGGVHWPLDIVAGLLTGLIGAVVVKSLLPRTLITK